MKLNNFLSLVVLFVAATASAAKQPIIGDPKAPAGGTYYESMSSEPEKLNPLTSTDVYASILHAFTVDGLMTVDPETYEMVPGLAERYEEDKAGKWYTFFLRKNAKWHDGKPVTAHDVKFSFDAVMDPKFETAHLRPYFENIEKAEVIDDYTVKFYIKTKYFNNFKVLASGGFMAIVPKHVYGDPKNKNSKKLIGSGPYKIEKYQKGKSISLVKNKNWWGADVAYYSGFYKPDRIMYRFIKEENVQLEMLKKGNLDFLEMTPEQYVQKATGPKWGKSVFKQQVENYAPKSYGFVGWNFLNPMFKDKDTRVALAHLMNRELMNTKFRFGMSLPATGPWYLQSPYASKKVEPFAFDVKKANALLKKAGWKDTDKDGLLDKVINGKKTNFSFTMMFANKDSEKYFTIYKEDLKKAGIEMHLKVVEWNTFIKSLDDKKFEAVSLGWGGGSVDNDPKQIWHSKSAIKGGSNFISYNNPEVDKLIDQGREELDKDKRIKIYNKIYEKIAADAPYAFMFNNKYILYGHSDRVKYSAPTYKYSIGRDTWWITK